MIAKFRTPGAATLIGLLATIIALVVIVPSVDGEVLARAFEAMLAAPLLAAGVLAAYLGAFVLRARAWTRVVPTLGMGHALAAILVSLGANHVLPLRLGEAVRVSSVVRRADVPLTVAGASTVTLRAGDVLALGALASVAGAGVVGELLGGWQYVLLAAASAAVAGGLWWLRRLVSTGRLDVRLPKLQVAALVAGAWLLEAPVIWAAARWAGAPIGPEEALLATTVTVAAQTVAIAPGGFGTYEAAGTAVLVALGVEPATALAIALTAHAVKTAFSLLAGAVALVVPAPGMAGRIRLARGVERLPERQQVDPVSPVVLFLPAFNEEATVASVVRRAPQSVCGHPVEVVVVDDGSHDGTAAAAAAAGARVVAHPSNRGLGAAVATGFDFSVARGAAAVAFCDADGEYAPEELERLVAPILDGSADYVVGSRFDGDIERMLPHRKFGNLVLTAALRFVARTPITDGQSGYRALSASAAGAAEMAHDYNYAQVLTLDLLAKGYRYAEVPISYRFRSEGQSFVRLGRYLRQVVPAVYRVVNRDPARA